MVCEHLRDIESAILQSGAPVTFRGAAWSENCREWVYFACYLDIERIRACFVVPACVADHAHRGTHDGQERGLVCETCKDAVMGFYEPLPGKPRFPAP